MKLLAITHPDGPLGSFRKRREWLRKLNQLPTSLPRGNPSSRTSLASHGEYHTEKEDMELLRWV